MVTKKTAAGKAKEKKLKLKRETIKDLEPKSKAVKGGIGPRTGILCTADCATATCRCIG